MADESGEDILRKAKQMELDAHNSFRRETETPTQYLNPEAREDAMKVARDVWSESIKLLGGGRSCC